MGFTWWALLAVDLVRQLHRDQHDCEASISEVAALQYQARGCGPDTRYQCVVQDQRVSCHTAQP
jgi:hypothetical protein